jgi:hypothetical protein
MDGRDLSRTDADVNTRNSDVSDVHYDWRGGWYTSVTDRLTGTYRLDSERSWTTPERPQTA